MHCPGHHDSRHVHCACKVNLRLHVCAYICARTWRPVIYYSDAHFMITNARRHYATQ